MIERARQDAPAKASAATAAPAPARAVQPGSYLPPDGDSTLVPMLIGGMVLIVIAMVGVMMFA